MISSSSQQYIHHLFEQRVEQAPEAIALIFQDQQISYRELNSRANQLANHLQLFGVKPEVLVGICAERSLEMVVGLLAILKAGGAFLALDPTYPQERINYMLEDAKVAILLTQEKLVESLSPYQEKLVIVERDRDLIAQQSSQNLENNSALENLSYVIYTSGSTGNPKGVMITHSNLSYYVQSMTIRLGIEQSDRYLHAASFAFSSSVRQLMLPLSMGATIYITNSEQRKDPIVMFELIKEHQITAIDIIPSYWRNCVNILAHLDPAKRTAILDNQLRLIVSASEPLPSDLPRLWSQEFKHGARLINMFGQTETTGIATTHQITLDEDSDRVKVVAIGKPLPNVQIYILDEYLQPSRIGDAGTIYVSGATLARGYLNRPDLTSEKFITNPFLKQEGDRIYDRIYNTGDLARYLPDGNIEFIGRMDDQVKIRGFRIELTEIEAVLANHASVRETVVTAREDISGDKRLVAYVVLFDQQQRSNDLRSFLQERLPDYMIPNTFVFLEAIPRTPNGKVDRRALPAPDHSNSQLETNFIAPRNPTEEILANIWADVLHVERISIHDNFFELGGHSLLAIQVILRCRQVFSVEVTFQHLFDSPTLTALALIISELKLQEIDLLTSQIITPRNKSNSLTLSFAQQRLWILDQLEPNSAFYNIQEAFRLIGDLQVQFLQQALDEISNRHEIIRTNYITEDGNPTQLINEPKSIELTTIDLQSYAEVEREIQTKKILLQESQRPFNLASDSILRGCLLQLAPEQHILLLVIHDIAADAWSMEILWEELTQLYQTFLTGHSNPLTALPIQYADFALWQREWLSKEVLEKQFNYWKQQLANVDSLLQLPTDFPRPIVQSHRGNCHSVSLPEKLSSSFPEICRREGVTLYMLLLAAFQTLLYRYTGQEDILIGSPIAGRNHTEVERLIGFFVNTLVLRTDFSGEPSFQQLLAKVRSTTIEAYSYQDVSFDKLVEELQPERSLAYNPIFQVMFSVEKSRMSQKEFAGLTATSLSIESKTAKFDLDVTVIEESGSKLIVLWNYNTDLFNLATIERMAGHFQTLLEGIVANSQQTVSQLPLLTKPEQEQLLLEWNHSQTEYTQECVHHLFEKQVELTPDAIAVIFQEQQLTYRELNNRANQLAHYLKASGVAPDVLVGICVERSLEMLVGLLGILKAGGAYVPLDPAYPTERLAYMLSDSQMTVLVTQQNLVSILPEHEARVVCLDRDWSDIAQQEEQNLLSQLTLENLAYVIYTSGSTGKPKGVQIPHGAVSNFLQSMQHKPGLTDQDILLAITTISFDIAVLELYLPLIVGSKVVLASREVSIDGNKLLALLKESHSTVMQATPATWQLLLSAGWQQRSRLKILCGGEALSQGLAHQLLSRASSLWNMYGPTEATVWATTYEVVSQSLIDSQRPAILIGKPIDNTLTYILDRYLQPVPIGVRGELYIGGVCLARGYLNRPDLNHEKFIANPFSHDLSDRLYKTGDIAKYLPNGDIEYVSRVDSQIKVRGFRIELGEIEVSLAKHPLIRELAVVVREENLEDKRMVAYIVPHQNQSPTNNDLREFLSKRLPQYMIPSSFVILESLPLTPNGKLDRKALHLLDLSEPLNEGFIAPRDRVEQELANIWSKLLGRNSIGIYDNFFDLGGHSLLSMRLISEIEKTFDYQLPLKLLFQISTIAEIAESIRHRTYTEKSITDDITFGLSIEDYRALLAHSAGKTGLRLGKRGLIINILPESQVSTKPFVWIGEVKTARRLKLRQPVYVMPGASLASSMNSHQDYISVIASLLVDELLTVQPSGSYSLGGWCYNGLVAMAMAQQLQRMGRSVELVTLIDVSGRFPLYRWLRLLNYYLGTLRFHLFNLSKLSLQEKWQYIIYRIKPKKLYSKEVKAFAPKSEFGEESLNLLSKPIIEYRPNVYGGKVLLISGSEQIVHGQRDVKYFDLSWLFPYNGWGNLLKGKVYVSKVPCDHLDLMEEPYSVETGEIIQQTVNLP